MPFSESLNFLLVLNGVRILGHLLPGYLADRVGAMNVFTATVLLSSISIYTWTAVSSVSGLYVWAAFYSVFFGAIQSLSPPALASLTSNLRKLGTRMGINFGVQSFGGLIGMPVAGALITGSSGAYLVAQMFSASCIAAGAICLAIARECKRRQADGGLWVKL